jgi:hypothetical protein
MVTVMRKPSAAIICPPSSSSSPPPWPTVLAVTHLSFFLCDKLATYGKREIRPGTTLGIIHRGAERELLLFYYYYYRNAPVVVAELDHECLEVADGGHQLQVLRLQPLVPTVHPQHRLPKPRNR